MRIIDLTDYGSSWLLSLLLVLSDDLTENHDRLVLQVGLNM